MTLTCYDCKTKTDDYVMERRQTSGGGQGEAYPQVFAGDFSSVPVHANRRECQAALQKRIDEEKRARIPFYDVPAV
jgi:hypothetical protein